MNDVQAFLSILKKKKKYSVNLIVSISYRCMMDSQVCPLFCYMLVHESSL
jgi:hypothetical protein